MVKIKEEDFRAHLPIDPGQGTRLLRENHLLQDLIAHSASLRTIRRTNVSFIMTETYTGNTFREKGGVVTVCVLDIGGVIVSKNRAVNYHVIEWINMSLSYVINIIKIDYSLHAVTLLLIHQHVQTLD